MPSKAKTISASAPAAQLQIPVKLLDKLVTGSMNVQISSLRTAASKEKQMARQVTANLEAKILMAERQQTANSF